MNLRQFLLLLLATAPLYLQGDQHVVIKDPVVDMAVSYPAAIDTAATQCRRAHQGLFNEQLCCLQESDEQMQVACQNLIYGFDPVTGAPRNSFWLYKKHIALLSHLAQSGIAHALPHPTYGQEPTIVLIYPWQQFSLGSRFKHIPECDTADSYAIARIDYETSIAIQDYIPHDCALVEIKQSPQQARRLFVTLVNNLIDRIAREGSDGVIPYIWGGSSFTQLYSQRDFYQENGAWQRTGKCNPYCGYDCSEFIMRMAQIAGVNFPWKVSLAMSESLKSLDNNDQLEDGDIIWTPGHVMIISSIERNEIIESRGYDSGYGCVHRLKLSECFERIATYSDLLDRYSTQQPITYLDKQGTPSSKSHHFKILKLHSERS